MATDLTFEQYKQNIKGLPKSEKVMKLKQELNNRRLLRSCEPRSGYPDPRKKQYIASDEQLQSLLQEIENNVEAYESTTKRRELIPYMNDRDLNWYFNAKNIPAQRELVMPTYEYFTEGAGKEIFEPLDFFNLLEKQNKDLLANKDRPFDVLNDLKSIPLTERERHTLLGFLLKWFGGYPINNGDEQCNTALRLIEKQFLSYPEDTPEKELCSADEKRRKKYAGITAHLSAVMPGIKVTTENDNETHLNDIFPESRYINNVKIDFENLPNYIIRKGIIQKFEVKHHRLDSEYQEWKNELASFLNSVPIEHRIKALSKGVEYGDKVLQYHKNNECTSPLECILDESWNRRLSLAKDMFSHVQPSPETKQETEPDEVDEKNKDFTTARQVLAIHFLLSECMVNSPTDCPTDVARFLQLVTNKETGASRIQDTNLYKRAKSPIKLKDAEAIKDLQFIRPFFENLGLVGIVAKIDKEIQHSMKK